MQVGSGHVIVQRQLAQVMVHAAQVGKVKACASLASVSMAAHETPLVAATLLSSFLPAAFLDRPWLGDFVLLLEEVFELLTLVSAFAFAFVGFGGRPLRF